MCNQPVLAAQRIFAAIDDQPALEAGQVCHAGHLEGKCGRVDLDRRRRHRARLGPLLAAVLDAHRRQVVTQRNARVEEPPAAPAVVPADAADGVVDDALQAVAKLGAAVLQVEVAPGLLVVLEPGIDPVGDNLAHIVVHHIAVAIAVGPVPQVVVAPPVQLQAGAPGVDGEAVVDDDRIVLHPDLGWLVGERGRVEEQHRVVAAEVDGVLAGAAAHGDRQRGG